MESMMTVTQLASYLNVGAHTIRLMARNKEIPSFKVRHEYRFILDEVLESLGRGREQNPLHRTSKDGIVMSRETYESVERGLKQSADGDTVDFATDTDEENQEIVEYDGKDFTKPNL